MESAVAVQQHSTMCPSRLAVSEGVGGGGGLHILTCTPHTKLYYHTTLQLYYQHHATAYTS